MLLNCMRKITNKVVGAFNRGEKCTYGNTHTDGVRLYLHGNCIAERVEGGFLVSDGGGWKYAPTKERLNGINGVRVYKKAGQWYLNGEMWDGEPRLVTN